MADGWVREAIRDQTRVIEEQNDILRDLVAVLNVIADNSKPVSKVIEVTPNV